MERQADKQWWTKIHDYLNNKDVKLTKADLDLLRRIRQGNFADKEIDPFEDWDFEKDDAELFAHPFNQATEPKRRFVPSKWERLKVSKYMLALKKGWMKTLAQRKQEEEDQERENDKLWDVWEDDTIVAWKPRRMPKPITAPKRDLPKHAESFNPPEEFLFDENEKKEWDAADPEDKEKNFLPAKYDALRKVPLYEDLIKEHFERCLDLYLCPRLLRKKVNVSDMSQLIPEMPSPNDLKPFPQQMSIEFSFHSTCVRALAISPNGLYLASGDEEHNLVIWHTRTSKIVRKYKLPNRVVDCV